MLYRGCAKSSVELMSNDLKRGNDDQLRGAEPVTEQKLRFQDCALDGVSIRDKNLHLSHFGDGGFKGAVFPAGARPNPR